MILGLTLVVGGVITYSTGTHRVADGSRKLSERADRLRRELAVEVPVPGRKEVRLRPGRYNIYDIDRRSRLNDPSASFPPLTTTPPPVTDGPIGPDGRPTTGQPGSTTIPGFFNRDPLDATVTITDATGSEIPQGPSSLSSFADAVGGDLVAQHEFTIDRVGTYTVETSGVGGGKVGIGRAGTTTSVGQVVGGAFQTLAGFILGGLGLLAFVGGLIWLLVADTSPPRVVPGGYPAAGWAPPPGAPYASPMPGYGPPGAWMPPNPTVPPPTAVGPGPGSGTGWAPPPPDPSAAPPSGGTWSPSAPGAPPSALTGDAWPPRPPETPPAP
jgi:hypothetical protein